MDFDRQFEPSYGTAVPVAPGVRRLTVNNPSAFTFYGTNSYLIGDTTLAVLDPGPGDEAQYDALLRAIGDRRVSHIFISHTHRDHSPLAARLKSATGAQTVGAGPHVAARPLRIGEVNPLDASADTDFMPDITVCDGDLVEGDGWTLETVLTPGHCANHAAFAMAGNGVLLSADHVMSWATSIVAPPDGSMSDYMASLDKVLARDETLYLPGHGGPVVSPRSFVRGLRTHRKMRERAILERIRHGDRTIAAMVQAIYRDTDPALYGAAGLSVLAHLEDLVARGAVKVDGEVALDGHYAPG